MLHYIPIDDEELIEVPVELITIGVGLEVFEKRMSRGAVDFNLCRDENNLHNSKILCSTFPKTGNSTPKRLLTNLKMSSLFPGSCSPN